MQMNKHRYPDSTFREALPAAGLASQHPPVAVEKDTSRNKDRSATGLLLDQRK